MKTSNTKTSKLNVSLMVLTALAMFMSLAGCHDWFGDRDHHDDHHEVHHDDHHDLDH
jgi:hypothetical protein